MRGYLIFRGYRLLQRLGFCIRVLLRYPVRRSLTNLPGLLLFLALFIALFFAISDRDVVADDTEIYIDTNLPGNAKPMVFLVLDYHPDLDITYCDDVSSATCERRMGEAYAELLRRIPSGRAALFDTLHAVFTTLFAELESVKVALVLSHDASCTGRRARGGPTVRGCSNGAYILQGLQDFEVGDSNGAKSTMLASLAALPATNARTAHTLQAKENYFEIFRYITGQAWHNMKLGWHDFGDESPANLPDHHELLAWDDSIVVNAKYESPLLAAPDTACSSLYAVNFLFDEISPDTAIDTNLQAPLAQGGMGLAETSFLDVVSWMAQTDLAPTPENGVWPTLDGEQTVRSYFVSNSANADAYARAGGTSKALSFTEPGQLLQDLRLVFREINATSSTLVSAAVPVNNFKRASTGRDVFLAQFAVDKHARPNWNGNLKKLKLPQAAIQAGSDEQQLQDAMQQPAIASDGRIAIDALTYWTDAQQLPPPVAEQKAGFDGHSVARGGAGQNIPGFLPSRLPELGDINAARTRQLFTSNASGDGLMGLGTSQAAMLRTNLGLPDEATAAEMIRWVRGQDVDDLDNDGNRHEARDWILGAALHSRPLALNFGARSGYTQANPDIRIYMGSEDGFMHSFRNTDVLGNESGVEDWAFMPRAVMHKMTLLRSNSPTTPHPYTVDGAPAAYIVDADADGTIGHDASGNKTTADRAVLYFGLRRGGRSYYAIDVTDPDNPQLLWTLDNTKDFAELGLTFSTPRVGTVQYGRSPTPVILFGGGYDPDKDAAHGPDEEGNAIYIVNALTGELVWKASHGATTGPESATEFTHRGLTDSIPSQLSVLDTNGDGITDRLYVGDTGGTVWRVDLPASASDNRTSWLVSELANLGRADAPPDTIANDRRFFHRPDFVPASDNYGAFDGVLIGSGNRASPRATGVDNYFFLLKDRNTTSGAVAGQPYNAAAFDSTRNAAGLTDVTSICSNAAACHAALINGWKLKLTEVGEKVLAPALTRLGKIYFTSFLPNSAPANPESACTPTSGGGRLYAVQLANGAPVTHFASTTDKPATLTPSDRHKSLSVGGIPAQVVPLGDSLLPPDLQPLATGERVLHKTYWYEEHVDGY